mmetsp:Transcript_10984/g.34575  ORF Transcript_10984/g.34575 Transcript_10984/m.34575 type:complete len:91 (-) Transcript_10984:540-812(-)
MPTLAFKYSIAPSMSARCKHSATYSHFAGEVFVIDADAERDDIVQRLLKECAPLHLSAPGPRRRVPSQSLGKSDSEFRRNALVFEVSCKT